MRGVWNKLLQKPNQELNEPPDQDIVNLRQKLNLALKKRRHERKSWL